jgi:hypothetical protein
LTEPAQVAPIVAEVDLQGEGSLLGTELDVGFAGLAPGDKFVVLLPPGFAVTSAGAIKDTTFDHLPNYAPHFSAMQLTGYGVARRATAIVDTTATKLPIALVFAPASRLDRPRHINAVVRKGGTVLGGMTWVVRPRP